MAPTYAEIVSGITNISLVKGLNEVFSLSKEEISPMVRECDVRWNSIETSLTLFYRKMTDLGFTFDGSDVICPNEGEAVNV